MRGAGWRLGGSNPAAKRGEEGEAAVAERPQIAV